ncbi:MAG: ferrous iron transport protein A [Hungatella sp.]|nr:ferrous iron transport protein A [Hungatella sp.]
MTLRDLKPGQQGKVTSISTTGAMKRRIMDMGVTPGVEIRVVKVAPLGDPVEVNVRGYELSLRKDEAAQVQVQM